MNTSCTSLNSTFSIEDETSYLTNFGTPQNFKKLSERPATVAAVKSKYYNTPLRTNGALNIHSKENLFSERKNPMQSNFLTPLHKNLTRNKFVNESPTFMSPINFNSGCHNFQKNQQGDDSFERLPSSASINSNDRLVQLEFEPKCTSLHESAYKSRLSLPKFNISTPLKDHEHYEIELLRKRVEAKKELLRRAQNGEKLEDYSHLRGPIYTGGEYDTPPKKLEFKRIEPLRDRNGEIMMSQQRRTEMERQKRRENGEKSPRDNPLIWDIVYRSASKGLIKGQDESSVAVSHPWSNVANRNTEKLPTVIQPSTEPPETETKKENSPKTRLVEKLKKYAEVNYGYRDPTKEDDKNKENIGPEDVAFRNRCQVFCEEVRVREQERKAACLLDSATRKKTTETPTVQNRHQTPVRGGLPVRETAASAMRLRAISANKTAVFATPAAAVRQIRAAVHTPSVKLWK